jgi:hypothetical protein
MVARGEHILRNPGLLKSSLKPSPFGTAITEPRYLEQIVNEFSIRQNLIGRHFVGLIIVILKMQDVFVIEGNCIIKSFPINFLRPSLWAPMGLSFIDLRCPRVSQASPGATIRSSLGGLVLMSSEAIGALCNRQSL